MSVRLPPDEIREKYDAIAGRYDRLEAVVEWLGIRARRRELFGRATGRVLEVAAGTGKNIPFYGPGVTSLTAVDLSPAMLDVARRRADAAPFPVELRVADAEALPFDDASFDTVTSSLSTCTFPDPVAALREMARVLEPDGRILLLEHGRSTTRWIARFQDRRAAAHAKLFGCQLNQEPLDHLHAAGLSIVRSSRALFGILHSIEARKSGAHGS